MGLVQALGTLGADIETTGGYAPLTVRSGRLNGGTVRVPATESSQFASGPAPRRAPRRGHGRHRAGGRSGVGVLSRPDGGRDGPLRGRGRAARAGAVPGSPPGRATGPATTGSRETGHRPATSWRRPRLAPGRVTVDGLDPASPQGERGFPALLRRMGCAVSEHPSADGIRVTVTGAPRLHGIAVDMRSMPDAVPTLAALAPFAEGPTRIHGIGHLRHKESDRIAALAAGLTRLGARVAATEDAPRHRTSGARRIPAGGGSRPLRRPPDRDGPRAHRAPPARRPHRKPSGGRQVVPGVLGGALPARGAGIARGRTRNELRRRGRALPQRGAGRRPGLERRQLLRKCRPTG